LTETGSTPSTAAMLFYISHSLHEGNSQVSTRIIKEENRGREERKGWEKLTM